MAARGMSLQHGQRRRRRPHPSRSSGAMRVLRLFGAKTHESNEIASAMSGVLTRVRAAFSTQTIENKRIIFRHRHRAPRKQGNYPVSGYPLYSSCPDGGTIALIYQLLVGRQMPIGCLGAVCFTANLWLKRQNHPESPAKSTGTNAGSRPDMSVRITRVKWITRYPVYVTKWDIMRHFVKKLYEMKPGTPFCFNDLLKPWKSAPSGQS